MNFLEFVPVGIFEILGIFAGLSACFVVAIQVRKEYLSKLPSPYVCNDLTDKFLPTKLNL